MQHTKFSKDEIIMYEGEPLRGIFLIRSGIVNVKMRSSLFQEYNIQRLYPGCSYGTYAFFVDNESQKKRSKFTLQAISPGDYFFIKYSLLSLLSQYDDTMKRICEVYTYRVRLHGTPWCDFKVFRKERNLNEIFLQALRRLILLNKQKRSQVQLIKKLNAHDIEPEEDGGKKRKIRSEIMQ